MNYDTNKVDETVLALLWLTSFRDHRDKPLRAWKGHDWNAMNRLFEKGYISDPKSKAKSVGLTGEGARRSEELFRRMFAQEA